MLLLRLLGLKGSKHWSRNVAERLNLSFSGLEAQYIRNGGRLV
jgi:hypothetical protein